MGAKLSKAVLTVVRDREQGFQLLERLLAIAQPSTVYSDPITVGEQTLITASEVSISVGFGYGIGGRARPEPAEGEVTGEENAQANSLQSDRLYGGGGGGGGGGGRPVAIISVGPRGVRVEPVIDTTKIALAALTTLGVMLMMLGKIFRAGR